MYFYNFLLYVSVIMREKKFFKSHSQRMCKMMVIKDHLNTFLSDTTDGMEERLLIELWKNWNMVMGPELSTIALPLGRHDQTLIIGGEDTMALQELTFMKTEILERVNAFMDMAFFEKIDLQLPMGRSLLYQNQIPTASNKKMLQVPKQLSISKDLLEADTNSPISRCYKAYLLMGGYLES